MKDMKSLLRKGGKKKAFEIKDPTSSADFGAKILKVTDNVLELAGDGGDPNSEVYCIEFRTERLGLLIQNRQRRSQGCYVDAFTKVLAM